MESSITIFFFFSSRRRHTRSLRDWSSDVCSSDLDLPHRLAADAHARLAHALADSPHGAERTSVEIADARPIVLGVRPQRAGQLVVAVRLPDRRLLGLAPLRLLERDGGLRGHAPLEVGTALLEEAVRGLAHDPR